jgi:hypothetical protein
VAGEFEMGKRLLKTMAVHSKQDIRWIRHALQRFGYRTLQNPTSTPDNTPELLFEVNRNGVRLSYNYGLERRTFTSVYDLGQYLRTLAK